MRNMGIYNRKYKTQAKLKGKDFNYAFLYKSLFIILIILIAGAASFFIYPQIINYSKNITLFNISNIEVTGNEIITHEDVIKTSEIMLNKTSIFINKKDLINKIKTNNLISDVNIIKKYPDKITINIQENKPVALINLENLYYINKDGKIYNKVNGTHPTNLPVITGIKKEEIKSDLIPQYALNALELIKYSSKGVRILGLNNISEIYCSNNQYFTIYTNDHGIPIQIKVSNVKQDFSRLESVLNHLYRSGFYEKTKKIVINTEKKLYYASFEE